MTKYSELWIDFETYSECDITEEGGMAYTLHPSTCMLCLGYGFDEEPAQLIRAIDDLPDDIIEHISKGGKVLAHNAAFDYRIWNYVCVEQLGWPALSLSQMVDTVAVCLTFQIPAKLVEAGAALRVKYQKNPEGKKLIAACCRPDKKGNQPDPTGNQRAYFDRLFAYCKQDVESMRSIIRALPREHLIPKEQEIWELTYEINTRGVPVDYEAIIAIRDYLAKYVKETMDAVPRLTNGFANTINQIAKIKDWCSIQGYDMPDLAADTVKKALADENCPDKVKEILILRQELGRSSTAKYTKLSKLAVYIEPNHYIHDNIQYHGAGTGRWAGRGFQIHNLPRASVPNPDEVIEAFVKGRRVDDPVTKGKALIRPMIKAIDDHVLLVSDYSSIENRALHWHAEDYETLAEFAAGLDQYKTMAAARYKVTYEQVEKPQRQMGKVIILGCLAVGTLVLTSSGIKPIETVLLTDKLWDGSAWVNHSGIAYKDYKPCLFLNGIFLTKDHKVFIEDHTKEESWLLVDNTQLKNQAICLVIGKLLNSFQELSLLNEMLAIESYVHSAELSLTKFWQALKKVIQQNVEIVEENQNTSLDWQLIVSLQGSIKQISIDLSTDGTQLKLDVLYQKLLSTRTTEVEVLKCVKNGSNFLYLLLSMLWGYQGSIIQTLKSTESTMTETTSQVTLNLAQDQKTFLTLDVLNAGPNNRFTIIGHEGPMLVSNCGFGMGKDTFQETADVQFGMKLSIEEADAAVRAYRQKYPKVVDLWKDLKNGCAKAVISGQRVIVNKVSFKTAKVKGRLWLCIVLPSGKALYYLNPQVEQRFIPGYEHMGKVPTVTHEGMNPYSRKWGRLALIPGRITENVVQATAREIMAQGMLNVRKNMPYVHIMPSVHDELITMVHKKYVTDTLLEEFNANLCSVEWAPDLPLKAEGWIGPRYRKD